MSPRFEQLIQTKAEAEADINRLRAQPLTPQTIREITGPMGKYGEGLAKRLEPHMGKTWEQAISDWSQAKPPTPGAPSTTPSTTPATTPPATGPSATSSSNDSSSMGGGAGFGSGSGKGEPGATPDAPGAAPAQAQTAAATITHETGYTASGAGNDRTTVGVGELVYFSADVNGAWTATAGTARGSGQQFDWTAPARANSSVTITFTPTTGAPITRTFSVLAPSSVVGVRRHRRPQVERHLGRSREGPGERRSVGKAGDPHARHLERRHRRCHRGPKCQARQYSGYRGDTRRNSEVTGE